MELLVARFELSPAAADSSSSLEGAAVVLLTQLVVTSSSNLLVPKYYHQFVCVLHFQHLLPPGASGIIPIIRVVFFFSHLSYFDFFLNAREMRVFN